MAIKIIEEPDIYLTPEEYNRFRLAWEAENMLTTAPVDFETYVRRRKKAISHDRKGENG